jgi:hypothetical protein
LLGGSRGSSSRAARRQQQQQERQQERHDRQHRGRSGRRCVVQWPEVYGCECLNVGVMVCLAHWLHAGPGAC